MGADAFYDPRHFDATLLQEANHFVRPLLAQMRASKRHAFLLGD